MVTRKGKTFQRKVYMLRGAYTDQIGPGRPEFVPTDAHYMQEVRLHIWDLIEKAGRDVLSQLDPKYSDTKSLVAQLVESGSLGNMIMSETNDKQAHRSGLLAGIHPDLEYLAGRGTEGACASGGLALSSEVDKILAGRSDIAIVVGAEEQNNLLPIYVADSLSGAGWVETQRGEGAAYFFPGKLSERVGHYISQFGIPDKLRAAMTEFVVQMYRNAWLNPKAQNFDYRKGNEDYIRKQAARVGTVAPNLSNLDCSLITDAGAAVILASYNGVQELRNQGIEIKKSDLIEIVGMGEASRDIKIATPTKPYMLTTTSEAVRKAYESAGITADQVGYVEVHDCFSNIGVMALEAAGFAEPGEGPELILDGAIARDGTLPVNATGGLIALGHPVGETGVRQAADIYRQLTGKAGDNQVNFNEDKPYALSINMGGDDGTVVATVYKKAA